MVTVDGQHRRWSLSSLNGWTSLNNQEIQDKCAWESRWGSRTVAIASACAEVSLCGVDCSGTQVLQQRSLEVYYCQLQAILFWPQFIPLQCIHRLLTGYSQFTHVSKNTADCLPCHKLWVLFIGHVLISEKLIKLKVSSVNSGCVGGPSWSVTTTIARRWSGDAGTPATEELLLGAGSENIYWSNQ